MNKTMACSGLHPELDRSTDTTAKARSTGATNTKQPRHSDVLSPSE
jgi:hypothetical protein